MKNITANTEDHLEQAMEHTWPILNTIAVLHHFLTLDIV